MVYTDHVVGGYLLSKSGGYFGSHSNDRGQSYSSRYQMVKDGSNNFNSLGNWRPGKDGCTNSELREVWNKRSR